MYLNKNLILVLLILVTITTTEVFGGKRTKVIYVNVGDYHTTCSALLTKSRHTTRANHTIQIFGETLEASRNYVIPYRTLATFFNLVLREDLVSELGAYLARRVRDIWDFFKENDGAGASPPDNEPRMPCDSTVTFEGNSATFDVDNRMLAAFTWMPGNMFYGPPPRRRPNGTIENFEKDAERIVGSQAFAVLSRLDRNMNKYLGYLSERTTSNLEIILQDLSELAEIKTPYEFDEADWRVVESDEADNKIFGIKEPEVQRTTHTYYWSDHQKIRTTWANSLGGLCDDYMKAADRVCEVYTSHLRLKLNTDFTHVDIESDNLPLFVYTINNKHYVYGQNKNTKAWSIRTVEPDGRVGAVTQHGSWELYYAVQFPFEINGNHYFYANDIYNEKSYWNIQKLNADGTIGRETDSGFEYSYKTQFHIYNNGQHYLYGRRNDNSKKWFLEILNADGTMGLWEKHSGTGTLYYHIQFPFNLGDTQYVAVRNTNSSFFCFSDINKFRFLNVSLSNVCTSLDLSYTVLFPISFGGKTYIFGHNPESKHWVLRQVFGDRLEQGFTNYAFTDAQPFNINGVQYFYARHKGDSHWSLHQFDYKYLEDDIDS